MEKNSNSFEVKNFVNFIFEMGMLKRHKHDGYTLVGVENPPSIAEHSLRAAIIGFILAKMENFPNPYEIVTMIVFHDIEEARIPDINKVANRYIKQVDKETLLKEQLDQRLGNIGEKIRKLRQRVNHWNQEDKAGIIAKDADYVEQAFTAKEYYEKGYKGCIDWIEKTELLVKTESAKKLIKKLKEVNSWDWWNGLKYFPQLEKTN